MQYQWDECVGCGKSSESQSSGLTRTSGGRRRVGCRTGAQYSIRIDRNELCKSSRKVVDKMRLECNNGARDSYHTRCCKADSVGNGHLEQLITGHSRTGSRERQSPSPETIKERSAGSTAAIPAAAKDGKCHVNNNGQLGSSAIT